MKTSEKIVHILSLLIAIAGGILSFGDKWISMPGVPPWLTHSWPTFVFAATVVDRMGNLLIDKIPKIFVSSNRSTVIGIVVILFLPVGLTGCAGFTGFGSSTVLYENGQPIFATSGDHTGLSYHKTKTESSFSTLTTNHGATTTAQWDGINQALGQVAGALKSSSGIPSLPTIPAAKSNAKP